MQLNTVTSSHCHWAKQHHSQVPKGRYKGVAASLWPIAAVAGVELLYICMKKTCYEYEGNGGSQ